MQELFTTLATVTEAAIALFIILGVCTMPRRRPVPGQLELELDAPMPEPIAVPMPVEPDIWDEPIAPFSPLPAVPLHTQPPYLRALPPVATVEPAAAIVWSELTPQLLRQHCQQRGIKWRNAHGKNKHLSKREMVEALSQTAIAA